MQQHQSTAEAAVGRAVDALGSLPVLSGTVLRVITLADDPESSTGDLVVAMETDEAFAANLLRFANSAHNARPIRASTIRQAVTLIGRAAVKRLALEAATYRFLEQVPGNGRPSRGHMHIPAVAVGSTAATIAERAGVGLDTPHLGGLLHDVGKLVMPMAFGEAAVERIAERCAGGAARVVAEREEFGIDHAVAGGVLAERWGLPGEVAEAVRLHHGGLDNAAAPTPEVACVQLANAVVEMIDGNEPDTALISRALTRLGIAAEELDEIAERALAGHGVAAGHGIGAEVARLEEQARIDDLTGILNRRAFLQHLRERISEGGAGAVVLCDVDEFKLVNDRHGHRVGDLLLVEVARVLSRFGTAGRLGGDEFGCWVSGTPADAERAASELGGVLRASLAEAPALQEVSVSCGIAAAGPDQDVLELLERADGQLYRRKAG